MEERYYTPKQLIDLLSLPKGRTSRPVLDLIHRGELKAHRISPRVYRVSESQLQEFLDERKVNCG